jgi:NAD(P)-dependent dehydrogenase (short-subunit alcohol dehydrogenase family)
MLPAKLKEDYNQFCALKRPAQLPEIASVIAWLALENTYVTGQTWLVDGAL